MTVSEQIESIRERQRWLEQTRDLSGSAIHRHATELCNDRGELLKIVDSQALEIERLKSQLYKPYPASGFTMKIEQGETK
jgi:hypothetical protein